MTLLLPAGKAGEVFLGRHWGLLPQGWARWAEWERDYWALLGRDHWAVLERPSDGVWGGTCLVSH